MNAKAILWVIFAVAALTVQASASDRSQITVHESNGNNAANAFVEVWDGGTRIDSGYTDSNGAFYTWLEKSINYKITASGNGQKGEWPEPNQQGFPVDTEIHINMH